MILNKIKRHLEESEQQQQKKRLKEAQNILKYLLHYRSEQGIYTTRYMTCVSQLYISHGAPKACYRDVHD